MLPGTFSWGIVTGVAMVKSGLTVPQALRMTLLVYSGVSQLSALPLLTWHWPYKLGTLTAALAGVGAGQRLVLVDAPGACNIHQNFDNPSLRKMP